MQNKMPDGKLLKNIALSQINEGILVAIIFRTVLLLNQWINSSTSDGLVTSQSSGSFSSYSHRTRKQCELPALPSLRRRRNSLEIVGERASILNKGLMTRRCSSYAMINNYLARLIVENNTNVCRRAL